MRKKIVLAIVVILIIIIAILSKNNISKSKTEYKIQDVQEFTYIKHKQGDLYGVINRDGKTIVDVKYNNIEIPNPQKPVFICYENSGRSIVLNDEQKQLFEKYESVEPIKIKNVATVLCYEKSVLKYKKDGLYGLMDFTGNEITKNEYTSIENLQGTEGKMTISKD